jgi:hypothetical protein
MNFNENELLSVALLGFDMIEGPKLKWHQIFTDSNINIDFENFLINFYLSFRGGSSETMKPQAILYDKFYIVAFPRGLELCCLFMKPQGIFPKIENLGRLAESIIIHMDEIESDVDSAGTQDYDEVKRIIINMLSAQQMSTPEIRRYFNMSNSKVWKIMSELEEAQRIYRTQKRGRTQFWTGYN